MIKGQVISGSYDKIILREKSEAGIEIGELLVTEHKGVKSILQVYDIIYGSQISQQNLELISGLQLEEDPDIDIYDKELRSYALAVSKNLITVKEGEAFISKHLPKIFSFARDVKEEDMDFLREDAGFFIGNLRSGSKELQLKVNLPSDKVLSHHILIAATTGRGKSNLNMVSLSSILAGRLAGVLVLDPHDEYFGRNSYGLKDIDSERISYYTTNPLPGSKSLKVNLSLLKPHHLSGVVSFTDPQRQAMNAYYKRFGERWISAIISESELNQDNERRLFAESTLGVVKRTFSQLLDIKISEEGLVSEGIFCTDSGINFLEDIYNDLEDSKIVILDTSTFTGSIELLLGSLIANKIFNKHRSFKRTGELADKPQISILLEEAPRVIGKDVLERGQNIFSTIAREGRKFKIGLIAVTQLPSTIPSDILANMNTKIILGIEMGPERKAIIESASQDLTEYNKAIASLDKGEAIITSSFTKFAIPVKIPLFKDLIRSLCSPAGNAPRSQKNSFSGVSLE